MELTRREALKLGLLGSAVLLLPLERTARAQLKEASRIPESKLPKPFQVPFSVPPVLRPVRRDATTDYYQVSMRQSRVQILPGFGKTTIFGYNGIAPGPTIKARGGRDTVVRQINRLPSRVVVGELGYEPTTSVHLHGSDSRPQYDGYAEDVSSPGEFKDYRYPNDQDARTMWYHDHAIHHTAENAYMGLAAQYHLHTEQELSLPIPHGRYDVPLIIKDAIFARDGSLIYDDEGHSTLMGDVILVNGRPWPTMKVERRKYRFLLLNASVSRGYRLVLSDSEEMTVIGTDAGLMPRPQPVGSLKLGMAERYEVIIDFSRYKVGQKVVLRNRDLKNNVDFDSTRRIMQFEVVSEATSEANNEIPGVLNPGNHPYNPMRLQESQATGTFKVDLVRRKGQWTINGKTWDRERIDERCDLNQIEVWEITNNSGGWFHPLHIHLVDFKILDRNGRPPYPYERGPKDTVYVGEGEEVRVIARFGPHNGRYMIHCHNLVHEDHDMMTQFEVGEGGLDPVTTAPPKPISEATPL